MSASPSSEAEKTTPRRPPLGAEVVLFDGECALCNGTVQELIKHDHRHSLHYAPLQGETAAEVLGRHGKLEQALSGMWLVENWGQDDEKLYHKSDAVLRIAELIEGKLPNAKLLRMIPRPLRQAGYELISRSRYWIFGKVDSCALATPEQRERILP